MNAASDIPAEGANSSSSGGAGWTPRSRFEAALRGEMPDRVPFVIWNNKLPGEGIDQGLVDADACIVVKSHLYDVEYVGANAESETWVGEDGYQRRRTIYRTPAGDLETIGVFRAVGDFRTEWVQTPPFRGPEDYDALLALIDGRRFVPCYDKFLKDDATYGSHGIARPATESTPMHEIIYRLLGVENFAMEWFDHRDHVLAVYNALLEARRNRLPILAESPAQHFVVGANISMEVVGTERLKQYYVPVMEEACEVLHARGKLVGAHLDANNRQLASLIAQTSLDYIESFTPPPDCDLSVAEARRVWPGKALYVNFPSSVHLAGVDAVRARARELMAEAAPGAGFTLGVLENVPHNDTLVPLAQCVRDLGVTPIGG